MQRKTVLAILLFLFFLPSTLFALEEVKTGYNLYHNLKLINDPKSIEDISASLLAAGYLKGCLDGLIIMQDYQYNEVFPPEIMTEEKRKEYSKSMNFKRLNLPKEGIATGQLILIYNKYAEEYPKELSGTPRSCVFKSLINAFGWK